MAKSTKTIKAGYLYVLIHPSNPGLYKVGQTIRHPEKRLAEHNSKSEEYTGRIVKETGQEWELKTYVAVPDVTWAETIFWGATGLADMPYRAGIEVQKMNWSLVQAGLDAVKKAGVRPPPQPLPDWIYAYGAWMNKRLEGRGISLVGHVRSKHGRSDFRCSNGHEWRTVPNNVAEGEGCPQCGLGKKNSDEIWRDAKEGFLCLLIHPSKPGLIKIGLTYRKPEQWHEEKLWGDWEVHRHRYVEEPPLAESLIWKLLDCHQPDKGGPINMDLSIAEQAFRDLIYRMRSEIALAEKAKENAT